MTPSIPDHEVLQRIGRGSYGEVWLARNALGHFRAVKIVHRDRFEDERPFEREFSGLECFEPISRSHPSQLQILHLGRTADSFYYVMELADDKVRGRQIESTDYSPKTLKSELHRCGRLPFLKCIEIGLGLCDALEHLHAHGLVHRDVKPSNVIFVEGRPKLADIGLVAAADDTLTVVGTQAYMLPNETPSALADLFALGKVLYEMSTGKSVAEFPELPAGMRGLPDRESIEALNHLVTKACDPNPQRRYKSVADLSADLRRLQAGQPMRSRSVLRGRRAAACGLAVFAAVLLVLAWWFGSARPFELRLLRRIQVSDISEWGKAKLGDWDGNGKPEILVAKGPEVFAFTTAGELTDGFAVAPLEAEAVTIHRARDVTGDVRDELFVSWRQRTNLTLGVFIQNFFAAKTFTVQGRYREIRASYNTDYSSHLTLGPLADLNGDGRRELIVLLNTGWELKPRAVCCFDFESQQLLWRHETAGQILSTRLLDVNGDGKLDVLFSTAAVSNGNVAPDGTTDDASFVGALTHDGHLLRQTQMAGILSYAELLPVALKGDHRKEIFVRVAASDLYRDQIPHEEMGDIRLLNATGQKIRTYDAGAMIYSSQAADLDGDGKMEVVLTDRHGFIHVLNSELTLRKKSRFAPPRFDEVQVELRDIQDLDGDGQAEIVLTSAQFRKIAMNNPGVAEAPPNFQLGFDFAVEVADQDLKPVTRYIIAKEVRGEMRTNVLVADLDRNGTKRIVLAGTRVDILEFVRGR